MFGVSIAQIAGVLGIASAFVALVLSILSRIDKHKTDRNLEKSEGKKADIDYQKMNLEMMKANLESMQETIDFMKDQVDSLTKANHASMEREKTTQEQLETVYKRLGECRAESAIMLDQLTSQKRTIEEHEIHISELKSNLDLARNQIKILEENRNDRN